MIRPGPETLTQTDRLPQPGDRCRECPAARKVSPAAEIDRCLTKLESGRRRFERLGIPQRLEILEQCVEGISKFAREWVRLACRAKGIPDGSPARHEEVIGGPVCTLRQLRLFQHSMRQIERYGTPRASARYSVRSDGRVGIPVTPSGGLLDPLVFIGVSARTWMLPDVTPENLTDYCAPAYRSLDESGTSLVLGAGNVSGIGTADTLTKLCVENRNVLLKMNPVNEYLGPIYERVFTPLIENDLLRIVYGGADVAARAIDDDRISDVHITGSNQTFDAIVWGASASERETAKRNGTPLLKKPISSELGNVSPWIVVPGSYSKISLNAQVGNIVASLTNNAAFNCVATRVILTWKQWPERERFLQLIESNLSRIPQRKAYYPGAIDRYAEFSGLEPGRARELSTRHRSNGSASGHQTSADGSTVFLGGTQPDDDTLPWTLIRNVAPDSAAPIFEKESFVCTAVEVPIDADSPEQFFERAVEFCNDRLWGTLAASVTLPSLLRRSKSERIRFDECINRMRYGVVTVNQWCGLGFGLLSPPFGGYPGSSPEDIQSGSGWVHNSHMLTGVEKTVVKFPLVTVPKPIWNPTHGAPERVSWALFDLMKRPTATNMTKLSFHALTGAMAGSP